METTDLSAYTEIEQGSLLSGFDLGLMMPIIVAALVATSILSVVFTLYLIVSIVRRRKLHQATLDMQKDIRKIRELLEKGSTFVQPGVSHPLDTIARQENIATSDQVNDPALNRLESRGPDHLA